MRRVFRARGKLVGTSDFVVTRGYVQIRVVGFPWETASLEAVVRCQDGALLLRRERAEARLWVYCRSQSSVASDRYAIRTRNLLERCATVAPIGRRHQRGTPPRYVSRLASAAVGHLGAALGGHAWRWCPGVTLCHAVICAVRPTVYERLASWLRARRGTARTGLPLCCHTWRSKHEIERRRRPFRGRLLGETPR